MNLPSKLIRQAMRASGARTRTAAIILGLRELVRKRQREGLVDLFGKIDLDPDLGASRRR